MELTQEFRNPFSVPLEATYIFPLPDRAAVTALRMECADHVIEGILKERSRARQDYDEAIAAGRRAAIAEEDRPGVFTMRAGNITPGERVTVRLILAQPLPFEDDEITFRFPLVVAPRYIPGPPLDGAQSGRGTAPDTGDVPDASRISPPVLLPGFPNPVRLTVTASIDPAGLPVTGIRSTLHAVASRDPDGRTVVSLRPGERLDRDFVLRLGLAARDEVTPVLLLTPDSGNSGSGAPEGTFTLTLFPPAPAAAGSRPRPRDVVLLLDRSGSMHGWKMTAARRAAARIIDTLTGTDRFAVLAFDHHAEQPPGLPRGLATATDRNRYRAVEWLARTGARGGTAMLEPLLRSAGLLAAGEEDRDRVLVLVTDGQVGNEDQILAQAGPQLAGTRVHAVGIDQAVNAGFLSRLAAAGRGRCELVESEDRLDDALDRIHRRIGSPLAAGLALTAHGLRIDPDATAPSRLPDLFPGVPLTITGRWHGQPSGTLTVRGTAAGGTPFERTAHGTAGGSAACRTIWARACVRDLEDRYAAAPAHDTAVLSRLEKQITSVSLQHGVLSRFTAFTAADSRAATDGTAPHQVTQPVELPAGWDMAAVLGGAESLMGGMPPALAAAAPDGPSRGFQPGIARRRRHTDRGPARTAQRNTAGPETDEMQGARPPVSPAESGGPAAPSRLPQARRQAADEAAALRAARETPKAGRVAILADLATRLRALLAWLADDPAAAGQAAALAALADKLAACDRPVPPRGADLDALCAEAICALDSFAAHGGPAAGSQPGPAAAFWKRAR